MRDRVRMPLVLVLAAAQFLVMLDSSILNVALPSIATDLGLSAVGTAWVVNAYFLTFGGLLLVSGRAADVFGRRRLFGVGVTLLAAGSILGGLSTSGGALVVARLVQGAGAAMLTPAAMSVLLARFSGPARAVAMSAWGAASTVGGAVGVTAGGLLTAVLGWRSVLFVTAGAAVALATAARALLPADGERVRRSFDVWGASLLTAAVVGTVFAVLSVPQHGLVSVEVIAAAAVATSALVGFVLVERSSTDPILTPAALRDPRVAGGVAVNLLGGAARVACFVLVALLLQQVLQYAPSIAGLAMLPTSLAGFAVSTLLLPKALNRLGAQRVVVLGLLLLTVAHLLLSRVAHGSAYLVSVLPALVCAAAGVAFSFTPTTLVIAEGMAAHNTGVGSGLASATAQIGGAIGVAVFGGLDAARRAVVIGAGGEHLAAAEAGLSAAHTAAAAVAALGVAVAVLSLPGLRGQLITRRGPARQVAEPAPGVTRG